MKQVRILSTQILIPLVATYLFGTARRGGNQGKRIKIKISSWFSLRIVRMREMSVEIWSCHQSIFFIKNEMAN